MSGRAVKRRMPMASAMTGAVALAQILFGSAAAGAPVLPGQLSSRFGIDEANPEASVPTAKERDRSPLEFGYFLQDLLERADQAQKSRNYDAVVRYYRAVAKAVPESAKGWSKLCEAYERVHDRERAIRACKYAIDRPAVELQDYMRYVQLTIGREGELGGAERAELGAVLAHLEKQEGTELAVSHLRCQVGVKLKDVPLMETCTRTLARLAPDDPKTVVFQWSMAVMKGQGDEAKRMLERARAAGVMRESIERMESVSTPSRGLSWRRAGIGAATVLLAVGVGAILFAAIRRRRALASRAAI